MRLFRLTAAVLAALLLCTAPAGAAMSPFRDVPPGSRDYAAVMDVTAHGLMHGVAPGLFAPAQPLTRAQLAVVVARFAGLGTRGPGPGFADVRPGAAYAPAVEAVAANGLMLGTRPHVFDPGGTVSRAEAAVVVARLDGLAHLAADLPGLPGVPAWAAGAAQAARDLGLMAGTPDGFGPDRPMTRAEAAELFHRLLRLPAAAVAREAGKAAAVVHVVPSGAEVGSGRRAVFHAYAHDAAGYILPAAFSWSGASRTGVFTAGRPGTYTVTARVAGGRAVGHATVTVVRASRLAFEALPPAALIGRRLAVRVAVLDSGGSVDRADGGRRIRLTVGGRAWTASDRAGVASFALPVTASGTLSATARGLTRATASLTAVRRPEWRLRLRGPIRVAAGRRFTVRARIGGPAAGRFPLTARTSGQLSLTSASGPALTLDGRGIGAGEVSVGVPGGAVRPARLHVRTAPAGHVVWSTPHVSLVAGDAVRLQFTATGHPAGVRVEPYGPDGHAWPDLEARLHGAGGQVTVRPLRAGVWRYRLLAPGYATGPDLELTVRPGPVTRIVADAAPTSVLIPGRAATLTAWLGDAYGNVVAPVVPRATLLHGSGRLEGRVYTATSPGRAEVALSDPMRPGLAPAHVEFRTVARRADVLAGKGLWLRWSDWRDNPASELIARARADGVTHFYLEVATTHDGFYGGRGLDTFLRQAHDAGIAVVSWIYPTLADPASDAALARRVARFVTPAGDRADGLAADIEERLSPRRVAAYAAAVRRAAGHGLFAAITFPPQQRPRYPFAALAPYVNAFVPMDYWHVYERDYTWAQAYSFVRDSVLQIRRLSGRPQVPVAVDIQAFDEFAPGKGGIFSPTAMEFRGAIRGARAAGAIGVSFYRWGSITRTGWAQIAAAPERYAVAPAPDRRRVPGAAADAASRPVAQR